MEIRQLRYFLAVADELSFTRAADVLNMAQPPLSRQIKALEDELGATLFLRTPRQLTLTAAGAVLRKEAEDILARVGGMKARLRQVAAADLPSLTVGFVTAAGAGLLPRIARYFRGEFPDVQLNVRCLTNRQQAEALRSGGIAVGLAWLPFELAHANVLPLQEDRFCVALPTDHELAGHDSVSRELLQRETVLFGCRTPTVGAKIMSLLNGNEDIQVVDDLGTALDGVAAGLGVAIVPASLRPERIGQVVYREIESGERLALGAVTLGADQPDAVQAFLASARACLGEYALSA